MSTPDARSAALTGLLDYAGMFPPARLPMAEAVAEYRRLRASPEAWFVARIIIPAGELAALAEQGGAGFPVSVLADAPLDEIPPDIKVVMVETRGGVPDGLPPVPVVVEVDWRDDGEMRAGLEHVAEHRRMAKLRCGGLTADAFPPPERVAAFQVACRELGLAYKLTAGLHQPFRHIDRRTGFRHHGFLNLLAAEVLGRAHGLGAETVAAIVADDAGAFRLDAAGLAWRDVAAGADAVAAGRRDGFVAYGSCDAREPLDALTQAGIL